MHSETDRKRERNNRNKRNRHAGRSQKQGPKKKKRIIYKSPSLSTTHAHRHAWTFQNKQSKSNIHILQIFAHVGLSSKNGSFQQEIFRLSLATPSISYSSPYANIVESEKKKYAELL